MNKKKFYLLSFIAPMLLLFIISTICGYIPFGEYTFNKFDAFYEYPTFLVELGRMLREGRSIFYTLHAGMGVNFFSILNLYGGSPLNLFSVFFDNTTIYIFYTILIYIKLGLAGLTMSIYLNSLNTKYKNTIWNVVFSLIYATSGWAIAMSMHVMWLDAYILLPLIIKGLDKLILENKYLEYTLFLALAIIINYYTGFMLCIFMVIYFIYKTLITNNFNKKTISKFIVFSILSALVSCVILIPTLFNLLNGRLSNLDFSFNYLSVDWFQVLSSLYNMSIGSFIEADHFDYGSTTLYISIFAFVLIICYFFNQKISKKNKIITLITLVFFHLCFSIPLLDYAWNMFQKPIWWEHRYQFVYVFFTLMIAYTSFSEEKDLTLSSKTKTLITVIFMILLIASFSYKVLGLNLSNIRVLLLFISILLFFIYLKIPRGKKYLILLIVLEISLNSYVTLSINRGFKDEEIVELALKINTKIDNTEKEYRSTTGAVDGGLMYNYNALEIFSSSNNSQVTKFLANLNITQFHPNAIVLSSPNPAVYSILGLKYIIGESSYFSCEDDLCVNKYALPIMYSVNSSILDIETTNDFKENINQIYSSLLESKADLFYDFPLEINLTGAELNEDGEFYNIEKEMEIILSTTVNKRCLIIFNNNQMAMQDEATFFINDEEYTFNENSDYLILLNESDTFQVIYQYKDTSQNIEPLNSHSFSALDLEVYEKSIKKIQETTNYKNIEDNNYILKGEVEVNNDLLLITIPYDEGLNIKIDGKEVDYFKVLDTFVGIKVNNGKHLVEITYFPKGLKIGSIISIVSLSSLLIYTKIQNKKKKGS